MITLYYLGSPNALPTYEGTAKFINIIDQLFDSVNGASEYSQARKNLRCAIKTDSPHIKFWEEAKSMLLTLKFIDKNNRQYTPPTVKNWVKTLDGFLYIWRNVKSEGFKYLCLRNLNQDPLENFFGSVRSRGTRNIMPTSSNFIGSYKSLLINNLISPKHLSTNCEEDGCDGPLDNLRYLLTWKYNCEEQVNSIDFEKFNITQDIQTSEIKTATYAYISGYVAKSILKKIKSCSFCKAKLISNINNPEHFVIECRAYSHKAFIRPTSFFNFIFMKVCYILSKVLPKICHNRNLKLNLFQLLKEHIHFAHNCPDHTLKDIFLNYAIIFFIKTWVKNINRSLNGLDQHVSHLIADPIRKKAQQKYLKSRKYRK